MKKQWMDISREARSRYVNLESVYFATEATLGAGETPKGKSESGDGTRPGDEAAVDGSRQAKIDPKGLKGKGNKEKEAAINAGKEVSGSVNE